MSLHIKTIKQYRGSIIIIKERLINTTTLLEAALRIFVSPVDLLVALLTSMLNQCIGKIFNPFLMPILVCYVFQGPPPECFIVLRTVHNM